MYTRLALFFLGLIFFTNLANAQVDPDAIGYYTDALRFSQTTQGGTARFLGLGGVNNALGADLSSLAGNPAGMGFYQKSEIGLTTAFGFSNTNTNYLKSISKDQRDYFYCPNFGLVLNGRKDESQEGAFRGGAFGVGLTRVQNFQNQFSYSGTNNANSITDFFVDIANGIPSDSLYNEFDNIHSLQGMAFWSYFIDQQAGNPTQYFTYKGDHPCKQQETVLTRGAINQWNFTYGGSFNDKVYIGASIGVPVLRYLSDKNYKETVQGSDTVDYYKFNENLKIRGTGVNFKIGMIAKPNDWFRFGLALQTPTYYSIKEEYSFSGQAKFKGVLVDDNYSGGGQFYLEDAKAKTDSPNLFKYNLVTPFKFSGGVALFAGKKGFISADFEYVPYSHARLKENSIYATDDHSTFIGDNKTINNIYKPTVNIAIGGELRQDIYRFRAGFSRQGDPYNNIDNVNRKVISISGGAGIRLENYYIDVALVNSRYNSIYKPYTLNNGMEPTANIKNTYNSLIISGGLYF